MRASAFTENGELDAPFIQYTSLTILKSETYPFGSGVHVVARKTQVAVTVAVVVFAVVSRDWVPPLRIALRNGSCVGD